MDFAITADHRKKIKGSERTNIYKRAENAAELEGDGDTFGN